jgi:hypothetical protein
MTDIKTAATSRREAVPAYALLVVQEAGDGLAAGMQAAGWEVVDSTAEPSAWLDDLLNLLTINSIAVSPAYLYGEADYSSELERCIELLPTYLILEEDVWLELSLDNEGD